MKEGFGKRLEKCLRLRGKKAIDVAVACDFSRGMMSNYLNGKRVPRMDRTIEIANYLNVSPYYLLGLADNMVVAEQKVLNSLVYDEEAEMKLALVHEITSLLTFEDLDTLKTILPVVKALCKHGNIQR